MLRLIGPLLTIPFLFLPVSAEASTVTPEQMVRRLKSIGVRTIRRPVCYLPQNLATYHRGTNVFCMSEGMFSRSKQDILKVVTHETVHVIQDCLGAGINRNKDGSIADYIVRTGIKSKQETTDMFLSRIRQSNLEAHVRRVAARSPNNLHARAEVEAYALESSPNLVYELINKLCR